MASTENRTEDGLQLIAARYPLLAKFLALDRWKEFFSLLRQECSAEQIPPLDSAAAALAFIVCGFPVLFALLEELTGRSSLNSTIAFGLCTVLALLLRSWLKLTHVPVSSWRQSMRTTHTAVALGCIPAIVIILFQPSLLASRHDALTTAVSSPPGQAPSLLFSVTMIVLSALWISVTEEFLFRGLLVSVVRRWRLIKLQRHRDLAAVIISAGLFGIAHYPSWGAAAAAALAGLGVGFVLAYIANGERILPVILYHFAFDTLSILVAVFS